MAMSDRSVLSQSLRIPAKDSKLFLLLLLFTLAVLPQLLLLQADHNLLTPNVWELTSNSAALSSMEAASPDGLTALMLLQLLLVDLRGLFLYLFITRAIASVFCIFKWIMVVHAVAMADQVTLRDLLRKVGSSWAGTFVTILLCFLLLSVHLGTLVVWVFVFWPLTLYVHPVLLVLTFLLPLLLLASSLAYVSLVLSLAQVTSVVEGGCYGFGAIDKVTKVMSGRRFRGFLHTLLVITIDFLVFFLYSFLVQMPVSLPAAVVTQGVVNLGLMSILPVFYMVVNSSRTSWPSGIDIVAGNKLPFDLSD